MKQTDARDAAWGGRARRKLGIARGALSTALEDLSESPDWLGVKRDLQKALKATADDQPEPCVMRASSTCVYLRDGTKVVLKRGRGKVWLEVDAQERGGAAGHSESAAAPDMKDITRCVICGRDLKAEREHVDTCGKRCFRTLLARQRAAASRDA